MAKKKENQRRAVVAFRLTLDEYRAGVRKAEAAGMEFNEWAREVVVGEIGNASPLTPNERIAFEELVRLRFLLGNAIGHLAHGTLTPENWEHVRRRSVEQVEHHTQVVLAAHQKKNPIDGDQAATPGDSEGGS